MEVLKYRMFKDGGTSEITTTEGTFCFDNRLKSSFKGRLFNGYPQKDNSNLIEDSEKLKECLIEALSEFKDEFYQETIDYLVESQRKSK